MNFLFYETTTSRECYMNISTPTVERNCDVCGRFEVLEITGSAIAPASIARCKICLNKGAESFGLAAVFFGRYGGDEIEEIKNRSTWKDGTYLSILEASKKYTNEFSDLFEEFLDTIRNP